MPSLLINKQDLYKIIHLFVFNNLKTPLIIYSKLDFVIVIFILVYSHSRINKFHQTTRKSPYQLKLSFEISYLICQDNIPLIRYHLEQYLLI